MRSRVSLSLSLTCSRSQAKPSTKPYSENNDTTMTSSIHDIYLMYRTADDDRHASQSSYSHALV